MFPFPVYYLIEFEYHKRKEKVLGESSLTLLLVMNGGKWAVEC